MPPRRMRGPTLAQLMQARQEGGYASSTPAEMTPEELALLKAEEAMRSPRGPQVDPTAAQQAARLQLGQMPTDADRAALWGRRGADVGATVSPDVFGAPEPGLQRAPGGVWASDPSAVREVPGVNVDETKRQFSQLASQAGLPAPEFSGTFMQIPGHYMPIDLRDESAVATYAKSIMGRAPTRAAVPDVVEGLMLKAREADANASDYMPLPKGVAEQYGVDGVNLGALSIAEKMTLRRMGVKLPARRR